MKKNFFIGFIILLLCGCSLEKQYNPKILHSIAKPSMNQSVIRTPEWYFFSNDKMYAYTGNGGNIGFYSFDLDGSNRKLIVDDRASVQEVKVRYPYFYLVKNDEAYFYMGYDNSLKKINLNTGNVTTLVKDKFLNLIPDTLEDGKVLVTYTNNYVDKSHVYFAFLNLQTAELTEEKKFNYSVIQPYYFSKNDNNIFYIDKAQSIGPTKAIYNIYKDNEVIYSYEADLKDRNENANNDLVFTQDNYIFVIIYNKILKLNRDNYSILEEKDVEDRYYLINSGSKGISRTLGTEEISTSSVTLESPIFGKDKDIYKFNSVTMNFEKIIDNDVYNRYVQKYENHLVIENDTQIIIYNVKTQNYKKYNASNYTVEDKYIYLMTYENDFYTSDAQFKVKKVLLDEI
jgi:hypothetical protein